MSFRHITAKLWEAVAVPTTAIPTTVVVVDSGMHPKTFSHRGRKLLDRPTNPDHSRYNRLSLASKATVVRNFVKIYPQLLNHPNGK